MLVIFFTIMQEYSALQIFLNDYCKSPQLRAPLSPCKQPGPVLTFIYIVVDHHQQAPLWWKSGNCKVSFILNRPLWPKPPPGAVPADDDPPLYKWGSKPIQAVCRERVELTELWEVICKNHSAHCAPPTWHVFYNINEGHMHNPHAGNRFPLI